MIRKFDNLEFVKEYPKVLGGKLPIRVYRTRHLPDNASKPTTEYRYHFGFPREAVEPLCPLLECTPYWGEEHWKEIDGFWLWWTSVIEKVTKNLPLDKLNNELQFYIHQAGMCVAFFEKNSNKEKKA